MLEWWGGEQSSPPAECNSGAPSNANRYDWRMLRYRVTSVGSSYSVLMEVLLYGLVKWALSGMYGYCRLCNVSRPQTNQDPELIEYLVEH